MDTVVAGALAAFTVDLLIYPLDTLKTRLQAPDVATRFPAGRGLYGGLYQGVGSVIVATLPAAGTFFTTYEHTKSFLTAQGSPLEHAPTALSHMLASSTAELVSCLILTPAEIIKQRAQVVNKQSQSTGAATSGSARHATATAVQAGMSAVKSVPENMSRPQAAKAVVEDVVDKVSKQAPKGSAAATARAVVLDARGNGQATTRIRPLAGNFGRSYLALAGRNLPFTAMQFPIYEHLRGVFGQWAGLKAGTHTEDGEVEDIRSSNDGQRRMHEVNVKTEFLKVGMVAGGSAAVAGSFAAVLTTPIDVAKTRIMLDTSNTANSLGVIATMRSIAAKEGLKALMKGGALRGAWTALGAGVYLGSYETGRLWWRDRQQRLEN